MSLNVQLELAGILSVGRRAARTFRCAEALLLRLEHELDNQRWADGLEDEP